MERLVDRKRLEDRLAALESRMAPAHALSPAEIAETAARLRAEGKKEAEVYRALEARDPLLAQRGLVRPAQYSIHDSPLIRLNHKWAARHHDRLVSIVGRLQDGGFSVSGPDGERHPVELSEDFDWRELDPLVVYALGLLVRVEAAWTIYWSRPKEVRARYGLAGFYIGTAKRRVKRLEVEAPAGEVEELRGILSRRIDWITAQTTEPASLPWEEFSIEGDAA